MEAVHGVLDDIGHQHRQQQHRAHLVQDGQKCLDKGYVGRAVYQWKADGDEQCRDKVRDKRVGSHLLQVAT